MSHSTKTSHCCAPVNKEARAFLKSVGVGMREICNEKAEIRLPPRAPSIAGEI